MTAFNPDGRYSYTYIDHYDACTQRKKDRIQSQNLRHAGGSMGRTNESGSTSQF